jgi:hypothetical protein
MEPLTTALRLLRRQSELEEAMRRPGGIRVTEEREFYELPDRLQKYPAVVRATLDASRRLHRPIDGCQSETSSRIMAAPRLWQGTAK